MVSVAMTFFDDDEWSSRIYLFLCSVQCMSLISSGQLCEILNVNVLYGKLYVVITPDHQLRTNFVRCCGT